MNIDTVVGEGTNLKGRFKESLGDAAGDPVLRREGMADQAAGKTRKLFGAAREFVRQQPLVAVGLASLAGLALFRNSRP